MYFEESDLHGWEEANFCDVALSYDPATSRATGTFQMRHSITSNGPEDMPYPETASIDLVYPTPTDPPIAP